MESKDERSSQKDVTVDYLAGDESDEAWTGRGQDLKSPVTVYIGDTEADTVVSPTAIWSTPEAPKETVGFRRKQQSNVPMTREELTAHLSATEARVNAAAGEMRAQTDRVVERVERIAERVDERATRMEERGSANEEAIKGLIERVDQRTALFEAKAGQLEERLLGELKGFHGEFKNISTTAEWSNKLGNFTLALLAILVAVVAIFTPVMCAQVDRIEDRIEQLGPRP